MPRYTDEDCLPAPAVKKSTGAAFLTAGELKVQDQKSTERTIVKLLAKEFRLSPAAIGEGTRRETGKFDYLLLGLHAIYSPKFPASLHVANPKKGTGQHFTLNRLLHNPEKYSLVGHFLAIKNENLKQGSQYAMLVGCHPRLGLLAVTDLKMEPDILCFQFQINPEKDLLKPRTLILAEIKHLLRAIHRQELWLPEAR